jgi:hypothetical protein
MLKYIVARATQPNLALSRVGRIILLSLIQFLALFVIRLCRFLDNLLFEQILLASALSFLLLPFGHLIKKKLKSFIRLEIFLAVILFFNLATTSLLNIDRSRSFYLLSWINKNQLICSKGVLDLKNVPSLEKLNQEAINQRILEQRDRNLVHFDYNSCGLTELGNFYLFLSTNLSNIFYLDGWKRNT